MKKNRVAGRALDSEWLRRTVESGPYTVFAAICGFANGLFHDDLTIVVIKRETLP
jgi:hypothetical protein